MGLNERKNYVNMNDFMVHDYAHRGLHDITQGIPENTLPAFARAVEYGFGAELDVHLTADGRLIVFHDDDLKRLCGVGKRTAEVRSEEFAAWGILGTEHRAPFLEDVLALFVGKKPLIVEIKTDGGNAAAVTEAACRVLDRFDVTYCIESFDPRVLLWLKQNRPEICRGQLSQDFIRRKNNLSKPLRFALTNLLGNSLTKPDFIAYKFEDRSCDAVRRCRSAGVSEFSWTVRSQADMDTAKKNGCAVIFEGFIPDGRVPAAAPEKGGAKLRYRAVQKPGKFVDLDCFVEWEQPDGTIRVPQPKENAFLAPQPFTAGGRVYISWK
ncbi:MAG: hypothetical protein IIY16_05760, partial [Oscillospiraceae bacterium]|nr:hypothetical protein [Oscillospiraceae bacterium]